LVRGFGGFAPMQLLTAPLVAPMPSGVRASAGCELPFGFGGETIAAACFLGEPLAIRQRAAPSDGDHGSVGSAFARHIPPPATHDQADDFVNQQPLNAVIDLVAALVEEFAELRVGDFEAPNGEGRDFDFALNLVGSEANF